MANRAYRASIKHPSNTTIGEYDFGVKVARLVQSALEEEIESNQHGIMHLRKSDVRPISIAAAETVLAAIGVTKKKRYKARGGK